MVWMTRNQLLWLITSFILMYAARSTIFRDLAIYMLQAVTPNLSIRGQHFPADHNQFYQTRR
jgi:hypothetical protein